MGTVGTYLNFRNQTEEAFLFYKKVFGTEFVGPIMRFGDMPSQEGMPPVAEHLRNLVMHVGLPITGGHLLMGTDACADLGFHEVVMGNHFFICLSPDSIAETDKLFGDLSEGGEVLMALSHTFWGSYHGSLKDRFGVQWMFDYVLPKP